MTSREERIANITPWIASASVLVAFFIMGFALPH